MPPSEKLPIAVLVQHLRSDPELVASMAAAQWQAFDAHYAQYEAKAIDQKTFLDGLFNLVGKPRVVATLKKATANMKTQGQPQTQQPAHAQQQPAHAQQPPPPVAQQPPPPPVAQQQQQQPVAVLSVTGSVQPSLGAAAAAAASQTAGTKRPREDQAPVGSTCRQGYADAASGAAGGGGSTSNADAAHPNPVALASDPIAMAGVDVNAEAGTGDIQAREGGDDEAATFGEGQMGELLQAKLTEMATKFGLEGGCEKAAMRAVAVALQVRIGGLMEDLRPVARHRANAARLAFGEDGYVKGTDPKVSWKARVAAKAAADAAKAAGGGDPSASAAAAEPRRPAATAPQPATGAGNAPSGSSGFGASLGAAAEEAAAAAAVEGTASAPKPLPEVSAVAQDVLYVLDNDPVESKGRVVQWWRGHHGPVVRTARQAVRLFPPPNPEL